jgi:hypothetical protein
VPARDRKDAGKVCEKLDMGPSRETKDDAFVYFEVG